jgi:diguanylate cyclase (GGDEF)-like protein
MRAAPPPSSRLRPTQFGDTAEALHAVSRLLDTDAQDSVLAMPDRLVGMARHFFRMSGAVLLRVSHSAGNVYLNAAEPALEWDTKRLLPLTTVEPVAQVAAGSGAAVPLLGPEAAELSASLGLPASDVGTLLLVPIRGRRITGYVLVLADSRPREFSDDQLDVAEAFAAALGSGLARFQRARADASENSRQAALSQASKSLNASLDLNRVLVRICEESAGILDADAAVVYAGDAHQGLCVEAATGLTPDAIGLRLEPGEGLAGQVAQRDEPMLTNDYQSLAGVPSLFSDLRSAVAVPMHWNGRLHGVLTVCWTRARTLGHEQLRLLTSFGDIAAAACRNATAHEGIVVAARTDALTGCINQAALHDTLRTELIRCERTGQKLSLAIVDLDEFKQVNERYGHLVGDEVLHRVGRALRRSVRPYDIVGRYGGDEFAIIAVDTGESDAREVAARAIEQVAQSLEEHESARDWAGATAGVAEWRVEDSPADLISRADQALLYAKHEGRRGTALCASAVPGRFSPQEALSESR